MPPNVLWERKLPGQISTQFLLLLSATGERVTTKRDLSRLETETYRSSSSSQTTRTSPASLMVEAGNWLRMGVMNG